MIKCDNTLKNKEQNTKIYIVHKTEYYLPAQNNNWQLQQNKNFKNHKKQKLFREKINNTERIRDSLLR